MVIIVIMVSNFDIYFSKGPLHYQTIWAGKERDRERERCVGGQAGVRMRSKKEGKTAK